MVARICHVWGVCAKLPWLQWRWSWGLTRSHCQAGLYTGVWGKCVKWFKMQLAAEKGNGWMNEQRRDSDYLAICLVVIWCREQQNLHQGNKQLTELKDAWACALQMCTVQHQLCKVLSFLFYVYASQIFNYLICCLHHLTPSCPVQ